MFLNRKDQVVTISNATAVPWTGLHRQHHGQRHHQPPKGRTPEGFSKEQRAKKVKNGSYFMTNSNLTSKINL